MNRMVFEELVDLINHQRSNLCRQQYFFIDSSWVTETIMELDLIKVKIESVLIAMSK